MLAHVRESAKANLLRHDGGISFAACISGETSIPASFN